MTDKERRTVEGITFEITRKKMKNMRMRMGEDNVIAAEARLNDVIAHAERLERENKVVDGDKWGDETTPRRNSGSVKIDNPGGRQKSLSRQNALDVNNMTCQSYFARDKIDRLFE